MPWRECCKMDERLRFVARLLEGEKMAVLCREFDISRKTGYKLFARYKDCGVEGLSDRSRRPYRHANRLPFQIETLIVQLKKEHPSWGLIVLAAGVIIALTFMWPEPLSDRSVADPVPRNYEQPDYQQCSADQRERDQDQCRQFEASHPEEIA